MFQGEETASLPVSLAETVVYQKIEEVLGELGRVRVNKRGNITISPRERFNSFLTDVSMEGNVRKTRDEYEISIAYSCKPSTANWIIIVIGTLTTCLGWVTIFVPMSSKSSVGRAIQDALADLEDSCTMRQPQRRGQ